MSNMLKLHYIIPKFHFLRLLVLTVLVPYLLAYMLKSGQSRQGNISMHGEYP